MSMNLLESRILLWIGFGWLITQFESTLKSFSWTMLRGNELKNFDNSDIAAGNELSITCVSKYSCNLCGSNKSCRLMNSLEYIWQEIYWKSLDLLFIQLISFFAGCQSSISFCFKWWIRRDYRRPNANIISAGNIMFHVDLSGGIRKY